MAIPVLHQAEQSECGLVSIAMVAGAYNYFIGLNQLRAQFVVSLKGTTLLDLANIAEQLKLETRAIRCELADLQHVLLPCILHWEMNHFVVLVKRKGNRFILHDPARGRVEVTQKEMNEKFTGVVLEVWPSPIFQSKDLRQRLKLTSIIPSMPQIPMAVMALFAFAVCVELIVLVIPVLQQLIIDDALGTANYGLLTTLVLATAVFILGQSATAAIRSLVQRNLSASLSMLVPAYIFRHLVSLPVSWFEKRSATDIVNRFESSNSIHDTLTTKVVVAGIDGLVASLTLTAMFLYNTVLGFVVLVAALCFGSIRILWYNSYRLNVQNSLVHKARVQGFMWETMRGIATVKSFNGTEKRRAGFLAQLSHFVLAETRIATADTFFSFLYDIIVGAEKVIVLYVGALYVLDDQLSIGMLIAFLSFRDNFVNKVRSLVSVGVEFRNLGVHLERLSDILQTPPEHKTERPFVGETQLTGEIEVRDVSYRYGQNEPEVLKNCHLSVGAEEVVGIVGPSGAGKSTLFKLIAGEFEPQSGEILIDGVPLRTVGLERFREQVAVVRQDDMLFNGTITENIAFLDENPDIERVFDVARKACIFKEIQQMPMGFNTLVGVLGTGLSGGQLQRVMLARAMYKRPKILLLDEATSALDIENEKAISDNLRELGITQIIVAHRPETTKRVDRIVDIRDITSFTPSH